MTENIHRLDWWPGVDDRLDPILAAGVSVALHLLTLLLFIASSLGSGISAKPGINGANNASVSALDASEFRQPLVLVSTPRPSKPVATTTEAEVELSTREETPSPSSTPEQRFDAKIVIDTLQSKASNASKKALTTNVPNATEEAGASSELKAREASAQSGNGGSSSDQLRTAYLAALRRAIQGKWSRNANHHGTCLITLRQTTGGNVTSSITSACDLDDADRMALEAAALMAQPLPYAGFESVFNEEITLEIND